MPASVRTLTGLAAARRIATLEREIWATHAGPTAAERLVKSQHASTTWDLEMFDLMQRLRPLPLGADVDGVRGALTELVSELAAKVAEAKQRLDAAVAGRPMLSAEREVLLPRASEAQLRQARRERGERLGAERPEMMGVGEECGTWVSVGNGGLPGLGKR